MRPMTCLFLTTSYRLVLPVLLLYSLSIHTVESAVVKTSHSKHDRIKKPVGDAQDVVDRPPAVNRSSGAGAAPPGFIDRALPILAPDSHNVPAAHENRKIKFEAADSMQTLPLPKKVQDDVVAMHHRPSLPPLVPLSLGELQPPDHMDGLRVEQDGHLNPEYHKEILVGNHHEFESESDTKLLSRLKVIFNKADKNHDGSLVHAELQAWILFKVREHLKEAVKENERIFAHLDADKDGYVTWREFQIHFLLAKGFPQAKAEKQAENHEALSLDTGDRERIIRHKFRWAEADEDPEDNRLTLQELQNFRHPEQSPTMLMRMVKDMIDNLDGDGDNIVTEEEFVALPRGHLDVGGDDQDRIWQDERRKEFQNVIDLNKDGKVDEAELKIYVDPHNENHANLEAGNLLQLADDNHDGRLSIEEVLENSELFFGSKVVNAGSNFHDEF